MIFTGNHDFHGNDDFDGTAETSWRKGLNLHAKHESRYVVGVFCWSDTHLVLLHGPCADLASPGPTPEPLINVTISWCF